MDKEGILKGRDSADEAGGVMVQKEDIKRRDDAERGHYEKGMMGEMVHLMKQWWCMGAFEKDRDLWGYVWVNIFTSSTLKVYTDQHHCLHESWPTVSSGKNWPDSQILTNERYMWYDVQDMVWSEQLYQASLKLITIASEHSHLCYTSPYITQLLEHFLTLKVLVAAIDAEWEGMGDVGSARYEPALLPPCPTIRVLSYSS